MRGIGVDIGTYSVKVAEVEAASKAGGVVVRDFYEMPLNLDPSQDDRIQRLEILKHIAQQYAPSTHRVVVGLSSESVSQRILSFPFTERRKILSSLPFELEDSVPFSQKDAIFDFKVISSAANNSRVLALAVPKRYVKNTLELCQDAGLDPDVISIDGIALANNFENYVTLPTLRLEEGQATQASLIIHIGYNKTIVMVVVQGVLLMSRAILFGGKDLANAVARAYQLPYHEALKAVAEKGFFLTTKEGATGDQIAFSDTLARAMQPLVGELQRTIVDVKAEFKVEFEKAWLMGGMSGLLGFGPYVTQQLEIPTNVFNHLQGLDRLDIAVTPEVERGSAAAIGLAIEGLKRPRNPPVNLRKAEFSKQGQNFQLIWENNKRVFIAAAIAYALVFIYSFMRIGVAETNLSKVDAALRNQLKSPALGGVAAGLKEANVKGFIKDKQNEIQARVETVRMNKMVPSLEILRKLTTAAPQKGKVTLDIKQFSILDEMLQVEGDVNSRAEIDALKMNWQKLDFVSKINQGTPIHQAAAGKIPFSLSIALKRLPAPLQKAGGS